VKRLWWKKNGMNGRVFEVEKEVGDVVTWGKVKLCRQVGRSGAKGQRQHAKRLWERIHMIRAQICLLLCFILCLSFCLATSLQTQRNCGNLPMGDCIMQTSSNHKTSRYWGFSNQVAGHQFYRPVQHYINWRPSPRASYVFHIKYIFRALAGMRQQLGCHPHAPLVCPFVPYGKCFGVT
jgi:hypothetical protein